MWGRQTREGKCGGDMTGEGSVGETCLVKGVWGRHVW